MMWRQGYAAWLGDIMVEKCEEWGLPALILGYAFKPETNLTVGSPAVLVGNLIQKDHPDIEIAYLDHHIQKNVPTDVPYAAVILIGCKHEDYPQMKFRKGSVVIDPHRYIPDQEGVEVIRIGE